MVPEKGDTVYFYVGSEDSIALVRGVVTRVGDGDFTVEHREVINQEGFEKYYDDVERGLVESYNGKETSKFDEIDRNKHWFFEQDLDNVKFGENL